MTSEQTGAPPRKRTEYYPLWLDDLADDVTLEAPAMNGTARGADLVHEIVVRAREIYEFQEFSFHGRCGDYFLEDYASAVHGEPLRVIVLVSLNAEGKAEHVVVNHRPRSSLLLFSRLMHEKFAGTPTAAHFLADDELDARPSMNTAAARPAPS